MNRRFFTLVSIAASFVLSTSVSDAAILTASTFSGQVLRFDDGGGAPTVFANVPGYNSAIDRLSGIAISPIDGRVFVSNQVGNTIATFDANGNNLGLFTLPANTQPAGLTVGSNGLLYVSGTGTNTVTSYNVGNPNSFSQQNTITIPNSFPNGLAFDLTGRLLISSVGGLGILASNATLASSTQIVNNPLANGQIAVDANDNFYVGSVAAFGPGSSVFKYTSAGSQIGNPWANVALPTPPLPFTSANETSPVAVAIDVNGNVIVGALGQTNPRSVTDNNQSNGGLFRYDPAGNVLLTLGTGLSPIGALAVIPVPEPTSGILVSLAALFLTRRQRRPASA